jgi:hypothetical protein
MTLNRKLAIALGITALAGAAVVQAGELGKATIPFAFEAAGKKLSAGTYTSETRPGGDVLIRNVTTNEAVFVMPRPSGIVRSGYSKLTFSCYGSNCFLSKMQFGGTQRTYQVPRSRHERELAKAERSEETLIAMR